MKQWGSGQADHILIPWHEGAVSPVPSSCMVLLAGQVSLGQVLSKKFWEMHGSIACKILVPFAFLKSNSVLYLYLSTVLGILSWRKNHQHKDTEILGDIQTWVSILGSSLCRDWTFIGSFFFLQVTNASCWHQAHAEHGEIKTRGGSTSPGHWVRAMWELRNRIFLVMLTEVKPRSIATHFFRGI